jgi:hypothetical protein
MEQARTHANHASGSADALPEAGARATAFGLDVHSEAPLVLLEGSGAAPTGRALGLSMQAGDAEDLGWPASAELACEELQPDGSLVYRIEAHATAGYLIYGPEYGAYVLSADGRQLQCAPGDRSAGAWQRLLIAQVLPFAALLQGMEVFHASAVVRDTEAVAFLGPSRAGKTSLALELCGRGASFLADDVLAVEVREEQLVAHPGTPIAGVDRTAAERLATNARERLVQMRGAREPTPLAALFFLDRRVDGPEQPRFEAAADAQLLLAATFNFVLATPARLRGLLDVCALAARLRVERIAIGPHTDTAELGAAVEQRLSSSP